MGDVTLTAESTKGPAPRQMVLETQVLGDAPVGFLPVEIELDIGKKIYGNGVGLRIKRTVHLPSIEKDGVRIPRAELESQCVNDSFARFEDALVRNADKLRQFLAGTLVEVVDAARWDPSGRAYMKPPTSSASPPPAPMPPPVPIPSAPPAITATVPAAAPAPGAPPPVALKLGK